MKEKSLSYSLSGDCYADQMALRACLARECDSCTLSCCSRVLVRKKMQHYLYELKKGSLGFNRQLSFIFNVATEKKGDL